jgi:hypothetical protein
MSGMIIVVYEIIFKRALVNRFELSGSAVAFVGCVITVMDFSAKKVNTEE